MEEIRKHIERRIESFKEDIQACRETLNDDYERFFMWEAEEMYKKNKMLGLYEELLAAVRKGILKETLAQKIARLEHEIIYGDVRRRSTDCMLNLLHVFNMEVKKKMMAICKQMLGEINCMKS